MTIEGSRATEHEENETEGLHDGSVARNRRSPAKPPQESWISRTVEGFYIQLANTLWKYGVRLEKLPSLSTPENPPPCFKLANASYKAWLEEACDAPPRARFDMPGEPNYCADCTFEFKARAVAAGACLFPNTRFEVIEFLGEKDVIGVSRPLEKPVDGDVLFNEMSVPAVALKAEIRHYMRARSTKKLTGSDLDNVPPYARKEFTRRRLGKALRAIR